MKFFAVVIFLFAYISLTLAAGLPTFVLPSENVVLLEKCDFQCPKVDVSVCGKNGQCIQKFHSQCALSAYNCKHPEKPFQLVADHLCERNGAPLCNLDDKRELHL